MNNEACFKEWYSTNWIDADEENPPYKDVQKKAYLAGYNKRQEQEKKLHGRRKEDKE